MQGVTINPNTLIETLIKGEYHNYHYQDRKKMIPPDLNHRGILRDFENVPNDIYRQVETFLSSSTLGHRYLLGRNKHSRLLAQTVEISGFVDDFFETGALWQGLPVIKIADLKANDFVVNCSMSIGPVSALARLRASRSRFVLNYSDLCRSKSYFFDLPDFVEATRKDFDENEGKLIHLYMHFADDESRCIMKALTGYRLTADPQYMRDFQVRFSDQYFEKFLNLTNAVFVDGGGFDGDTSEEFCRRFPVFKKIYFFEPSKKNIEIAQIRLMQYSNIEFIQMGLSNALGTLSFNSDAGSASAISVEGTEKIDVTTLDKFVADKVTFIKMDLEGWEIQALQGSVRHIAEDYPTLAISVYHNAGDFWRIYEYVNSIRDDYNIYLRHYTEGWSETVMFFVPKINLHQSKQ